MKYFTYSSYCFGDHVTRNECCDNDSAALVQSVVRCEGVMRRGGSLTNCFPDFKMNVQVMEPSWKWSPKHGAVEFNMDFGEVGLGMLVLTGKQPNRERRYCHDFFERNRHINMDDGSRWEMPLPPVQLVERPLLYYIYFYISGEYVDFESRIKESKPYTDAIGLAFAQAHLGRSCYETPPV